MGSVQEIFYEGTGAVRDGESHGAVGHAETVWAHFLSHNERCRADLDYKSLRRRLRRRGLSWEGLEGDTAGVLACCHEISVEM
jgi:hypothetical protein